VDRVDDDVIRELVVRLARPHRSGGTVIERAAILAEGADFDAVMTWILAHDGTPEAAVAPRVGGGLHGARSGGVDQTARRFLLPPGALD
jgi:hypothetical protein